MRYGYIKAPPGYTLKRRESVGRKIRTLFSLSLLTIGVAALTSVIYPILSFGYTYSPKFKNVPEIASAQTLETPAVETPTFLPEFINTNLDYTRAENWFAGDKSYLENKQISKEITYSLSIPNLRISDALVRYGEDDLSKSLVQYPGTAMPGTLGNTVVLGHSTLPQFFSPTNYKTIFSTLHTLELGNQVDISYDGVEYQYVITNMYEVEPENLTPLAQRYDRRILTLITCTPPGTYLRRLIVVAELA